MHYTESVVVQYDLNGKYIATYKNCREAAKKIYCFPRCIEKVCRGEALTIVGYMFRRIGKNEPIKDIEPYNPIKHGNKPKKVMRINMQDANDVAIYDSIKFAATENKCDPKSIRETLKGKQSKAAGYYWKYAE